ncbi:MAG: hypothetical protein QNK27_09695 [Desulfuromusa sp.]|nr:hypothetical protein [Desulfuromusa sp.]
MLKKTVLHVKLLSTTVSKLGTVPSTIGGCPEVYDPRRTAVVRTAKARDSPHAGTVPFLLQLQV